MMDITNTAMVPIEDLYLHPLNVRSEPPSAEIEALAHSIRDKGLIQNLSGWADPEREGMIGIVAGGRRLRALRLLAKQDGVFSVPVKLATDAAEARDWAGTENTARAALHPADEIRAYGSMQLAGRTKAEIARAFAVSEHHVAQRLGLARLPAETIEALRTGQLNLDEAKALTRIQDMKHQKDLTAAVVRGEIGAHHIRKTAEQGKVRGTDRRVKFVGRAEYEAAGGQIIGDLFSDEVLFTDENLLRRLFDERLAREVAAARDDGFAWVQFSAEPSIYDLQPHKCYTSAKPPHIPLPEADQEEFEELNQISCWNRNETQQARLEELRQRQVGEFDPEDYPTMGITLYVDESGQLKASPYKKIEGSTEAVNDEEQEEATVAPAPKTDKIPQNLKDDLAAILLLSVQKRLMSQPELVLDLLAYQLGYVAHAWEQSIAMQLSTPRIQPEKPEGTIVPEALIAEPERGPSSPAAFAKFQAQGKKHRNTILATMLARAFWGRGGIGPMIAHQLKADVRDVWTPTAAGYLSRLPADALDVIRVDLVPEDAEFDVSEWAGMKKADKAKWLDRLFNDLSLREALKLSREQNAAIDKWLPAELIWPVPELAEDAA